MNFSCAQLFIHLMSPSGLARQALYLLPVSGSSGIAKGAFIIRVSKSFTFQIGALLKVKGGTIHNQAEQTLMYVYPRVSH